MGTSPFFVDRQLLSHQTVAALHVAVEGFVECTMPRSEQRVGKTAAKEKAIHRMQNGQQLSSMSVALVRLTE